MVIVEARSSYRDWLVGVMSEDGKGAGGIEGHPFDSASIDVVLVENLLDRVADASPYVIGGLFLETNVLVTSCYGRLGLFT